MISDETLFADSVVEKYVSANMFLIRYAIAYFLIIDISGTISSHNFNSN